MQTALSRFVLPLPVLFFPACCNFLLEKVRLMPRKIWARQILELSLCCMSLTVALPMSIALFKQRSVIQAEQLEEEFRDLKNESGEAIKEFYFNKGA